MTTTLEMAMLRPADDLGEVLTGRAIAADLRQSIEAELEEQGSVVVDFDGVAIISPSFADELFAKLPREAVLSGRVRFENLDADHESLVRFVFQGRTTGHSSTAA